MHDVMITGFPRSGTSYFCSLLNKLPNFAVLNEPEEYFTLFTSDYGTNLARYYRELREEIIKGQPIGNKLVQDTVTNNARQPWLPNNLTHENFTLATKKTLKYLFTLTKFSEVEEKPIKVVVLIRNPYDNISSWIRSFEHMRTVQIQKFHEDDFLHLFFSESQRETIQHINTQADLSVKRCMFWNFLAECVLANREYVTLVKYEELIENPTEIISQVFDLPHREVAGLITKSHQEKKPLHLSKEDVIHIQILCKDQAEQLGYRV